MPKDREQWLTVAEDELVMRRRAYWLNLLGRDETSNKTSVTVHIPKRNRFDVASLRALMEQSRTGRLQ